MEQNPFNIFMHQNKLVIRIRDYGKKSIEARQIAKRLKDLLPQRLREIRSGHKGLSAGRAGRRALTDPRYLAHMDEIVESQRLAAYHRIQFETHMMLLEARRSLRAFRK